MTLGLPRVFIGRDKISKGIFRLFGRNYYPSSFILQSRITNEFFLFFFSTNERTRVKKFANLPIESHVFSNIRIFSSLDRYCRRTITIIIVSRSVIERRQEVGGGEGDLSIAKARNAGPIVLPRRLSGFSLSLYERVLGNCCARYRSRRCAAIDHLPSSMTVR